MKFAIGDIVVLSVIGQNCLVIGRAEYFNDEPSYFLRYKDAQGNAVEQWWTESALA